MVKNQMRQMKTEASFFWMLGFGLFIPFIFFWPRALPGLLIYFAGVSLLQLDHRRITLLKSHDLFWIMFLFFLYAIFSLLWASSPQYGMIEILKLIIYSCSGLMTLNFLANQKRDFIKKILNIMSYATIVSSVIWISLYLVDFKFLSFDLGAKISYDLGSFRRGSHLCAVLLFPLSLYLWQVKRQFLSFFVFALLFTVVYLSSKHTAFLVILMTAGLLPFVWLLRGYFIRFCQISLVIFFFFAPIVVEPFVQPALTYAENAKENDIKIPTSFLHRLKIWEFTSQKIIERPIQGYGFGSSRFLGEGHRTSLSVSILPYFKRMTIEQQEKTIILFREAGLNLHNKMFVLDDLSLLPLHPHNAFLQIWLEVGLIGMLIAAAFLFFLFEKGINLVKRSQQLVFMGGLFPALVVVNMSYGLWQSWWVCSLFIVAVVIQMICRVLAEKDRS